MKAICFNCRFVGIGIASARCPACGYPLIQNSLAVGLGAHELEQAFEETALVRSHDTPLPGVIFRAPKSILRKKRRPTTRPEGAGTSLAALPRTRNVGRIAGEVFAASAAFLTGLFVTLRAFGAL